MPSRALLIEVRLLNGRYHGVGDWPPAPFRLFQALVAGAYGARWRSEPAADKDAAFRWLEGLAPPHVAAPPKVDTRSTTYFVPNNDLDAVGGDPRRVSEIRAGKPVRAVLFEGDAPCLYAWPFDDGEDHARLLAGLAERLHTLGLGIDAAFARADVCDWNEAEARLAGCGAIGRPRAAGTSRDPTCPIRGSLDSVRKRYDSGSRRFETQREGRTTVTLFRQPPKAQFQTVAYDRPPARLLFELRPADGSRPYEKVPQERAADLTKSVRDLAAGRLTEAFPDRAHEVARLIVGAGVTSADSARRVRFIPLPSIGFEHTDPAIRRILVEVPPDCPIATSDIAWALSGRSVSGLDQIDASTGEITAETILAPTAEENMLRHFGIGTEPERRWRTITPVALPERPLRGRLTGEARAAGGQRAAAAVAEALRHAGMSWRNLEIRVQNEPFHRKGVRADAFRPDRFAGRLQHVEIVLENPAPGPLVIGDGRWLGLGVMAPASEPPRTVHLFAIDPSEAPPVSEREGLIRALRRAVMARVNEVTVQRRNKGGERSGNKDALETYFTGHLSDGSPARSGQHKHLFFLADDADGDGKIDRVAVVAPHIADRSFEPGRHDERALELLDQALNDLTILRAGRAGVSRLQRVDTIDRTDPIFGFSVTWSSRTQYRPTRHPKSRNPEAELRNDLATECRRRALLDPEVEILKVAAGPRSGIAVWAQLRFPASIRGPLMLGTGSHLGGGLFAASWSR